MYQFHQKVDSQIPVHFFKHVTNTVKQLHIAGSSGQVTAVREMPGLHIAGSSGQVTAVREMPGLNAVVLIMTTTVTQPGSTLHTTYCSMCTMSRSTQPPILHWEAKLSTNIHVE